MERCVVVEGCLNVVIYLFYHFYALDESDESCFSFLFVLLYQGGTPLVVSFVQILRMKRKCKSFITVLAPISNSFGCFVDVHIEKVKSSMHLGNPQYWGYRGVRKPSFEMCFFFNCTVVLFVGISKHNYFLGLLLVEIRPRNGTCCEVMEAIIAGAIISFAFFWKTLFSVKRRFFMRSDFYSNSFWAQVSWLVLMALLWLTCWTISFLLEKFNSPPE